MTQTGDDPRHGRLHEPRASTGKPVDKRTDIWAFGCVLYEMLTGSAVFTRSTTSDTVAAILGSEPEWERLPAGTPPTIRRLLQRCLEKDAKRRLRDIGDAGIEIDEALVVPAAADAQNDTRSVTAAGARWWRAVAALAVVTLTAGAIAVWKATPTTDQLVNATVSAFAIHLQPGQQLPIDSGLPIVLAISPDGQQVVYAARDVDGDRLYLRRRHELEASPIPGTEGAIGPFFSPDGQSIGFAAGGVLRVLPLAGGPTRTLGDAANLEGASWGPDGVIVYSPRWQGGLFRVSATGGTAEPLTATGEYHKAPHVLPGGKAVLTCVNRDKVWVIEAVEIATGNRRPLIEGQNPSYVRTGHVVFARGTSLFAVPFDITRLAVTGEAVQLMDGLRVDGNDTHFAVANDGTLVYVPEIATQSRLVWFDRRGGSRPLDAQPRRYAHPRISPDGTRVVVTVVRESGGNEIWIYDVERGAHAQLSATGRVSRPIWTADSKRLTFQRDGDLYSAPADDSAGPQLLLKRDAPELVLRRETRMTSIFPLDWSSDGSVLVFSAPAPTTNRDVWTLRGEMATPFLITPRDERAAMFSPDGRWIVYAAKETGREEQVYVQPYPGPGGREVISRGGGIEPVWSSTGREIFFRSVDGTQIMSVDVRTETSFAAGTPTVLFAGRFAILDGSYWSNYDVSRDGQSFLMLEADQTSTPRLNVVVNWANALASR